MEKKRVIYIINPNSGVGRKGMLARQIRRETDTSKIDLEVLHTSYHGHAMDLARQYSNIADAVVAVGGDGTVNEVGTGLIGSRTALGIIPAGSGNGLARELDIPMRTAQAISVINEMYTRDIDVMRINDRYSLNVAGVGFDAFISHKFAKVKTRGPLQYMNLIAREYPKYTSAQYNITIDGHPLQRNAFLISFANSTQWGNNIHIAPNARIDDGLIDVCIVSEFPAHAIPSLLISLFNQTIDKNRYDEIILAKKIEIAAGRPLYAHVDGEPITITDGAQIEIMPLALRTIVPSPEFLKKWFFTPSDIKDLIQANLPQLPLPDINLKELQKLQNLPPIKNIKDLNALKNLRSPKKK